MLNVSIPLRYVDNLILPLCWQDRQSWFQYLLGTLITHTANCSGFNLLLVSIPLRYADNRGRKGDCYTGREVSIPLRYADNRSPSPTNTPTSTVSIPLRYADNLEWLWGSQLINRFQFLLGTLITNTATTLRWTENWVSIPLRYADNCLKAVSFLFCG